MAKYRIVRVARAGVPEVDEENKRLGPLGAEVVGASYASEDELVAALKGADGVLNYGGRFPESVIRRLDDVWIIVQASTGYDLIDVEAATEAGIMVANLPFQCLHEVANSAIAYLLALNRKIVEADRRVRAGEWGQRDFLPIGPIYGETLGLLGFGNIAKATARKAQALDMTVIAYDPFADASAAQALFGVELVPMGELCRRADYVSCHLPHNRQTERMIGEAEFRMMKPTTYFINTSRGKVVDEPALVRALQEGWIAGAGLDVFQTEPLPMESPLRKMDNVLLAPHLAGTSNVSVKNNRFMAIEQMAEALTRGAPPALVNRNVRVRVKVGAV